MKINDLNFKDNKSGYSFIRQCLLKEEWQDGAKEYNKKVHQLIEESASTEEFVEKYLANTDWKKEQCYQVMLKEYNPDAVWYYVREMFGDKCKKASSDAGSLKIGAEDFSINIPNGYGDGITRYAILENSEYYANSIMRFYTMVNGKFNIYSYDCGNEIAEELIGKFGVYHYNGFVALVKMEEQI